MTSAIDNPLTLAVLGAMHRIGPATINALSEETGEARDKVGVVCRRLAAADYATRTVGKHFRDERFWSLTPDGEELRARLHALLDSESKEERPRVNEAVPQPVSTTG